MGQILNYTFKRNRLALFIIIISWIIAMQNTNAQSHKLDSLKLSLSNIPTDTVKVYEIDTIIHATYRLYPDTALKYALINKKLCENLEFEFGLGFTYNRLGNIYKYKHLYDSSINNFNKAILIFEKSNNLLWIGSVYNNLGLLYKNQSKYTKAIEALIKSAEYWEQIKKPAYVASAYNNIGIIYNNTRNHKKSIEYIQKSIDIRINLKDYSRICGSYINLGNNYVQLRKDSLAIKTFKKAESILEKCHSETNEILINHNLGTAYERIKNYETALSYYKKSLSLCERYDNKNHLMLAKQGIGNILCLTGKSKKGIKYLKESASLAKEMDDYYNLKNINYSISRAYKLQNDYKRAYNYFIVAHNINDSIFTLERDRQIVEIEEKYKSEKKEQQIKLLEAENKLQGLDIKNKKLISYILAGAILLSLSLTIWFWYDARKKRRKNRLLTHLNELIEENRQLISEQKEKLETANNTKDRMFQIITHDLRSPLVSIDNLTKLIPLYIEEKNYDTLYELASSMDSSIARIITLVDSLLSWAMSQQGELPYHPEEINLYEVCEEAIKLYSSFEKLKKLEFSVQISKEIYVHADRNILSTVIRNLINNSVKFTEEHGEIIIQAFTQGEDVRIILKDTGIGIAKDKLDNIFELGKNGDLKKDHTKGLGLFFCKEFVQMNKGEISVESSQNKGTTFIFTVPKAIHENANF